MTNIMSDFWSLVFSFPTEKEGVELAIVEVLSEALIIMMMAFESFRKNESHEIEDIVSAFERNGSLDEIRQHSVM